MNLRRLEFSLTHKCNSKCIYCQADASPLRSDVMDVRDAHDYLAEAVSVSRLESILVFGGEPMLYPARTMAIFEKAHGLGVPKIEMLTNGVWGNCPERAEGVAAKLREAGLNDLGISVDAFHQQFIPLDYLRNAAEASVKAGIEEVVWNVAVIESANAKNEYDSKTHQILKALEPVGIKAHIHKVEPFGRAAKTLREHFPSSSLEGPCEGEQLMGSSLRAPEVVTIEPTGSVDICWGLSIGNAKEKPLSQIISYYDWRKNPLTKILVQKGPTGLMEQNQQSQSSKGGYINKCHLCVEIRRSLKES